VGRGEEEGGGSAEDDGGGSGGQTEGWGVKRRIDRPVRRGVGEGRRLKKGVRKTG